MLPRRAQGDKDVMDAIQSMRTLSALTPASAGGSAGPSASCAETGRATANVPDDLSREKLKEIMTYNADLLERELGPIKKEMARQRRAGKNPQVDTEALLELQGRISAQVQERYHVTDEQVMAAVEKFGAREDPAFKGILQRIASTLHTSLQ